LLLPGEYRMDAAMPFPLARYAAPARITRGMSLPAGTHLGPYQVAAQIGAGGMGEVSRARDTRLEREVAIKVLPETFAHDPDRVARFRREADRDATSRVQSIVHTRRDSQGRGA
jgi:serine/threonine protein kinase